MRPSEALEKNRLNILALAKKYPVSNVRLFGSVLRRADTDKSDLDLLVDCEPSCSLVDLAELNLELESLLQCPVDLIEAAALKPFLREQVINEAVPL